jgi:hypothetical protein
MGNSSNNIALKQSFSKASSLPNVDENNYTVNQRRRKYKTNCIKCNSDRGYKMLKEAKRPCIKCSKTGQYIRSKEQIEQFVERCKGSRIGKKHSESTKIKLSERQKKYCKIYGNQFITGKSKGKHSKKTIAKMSVSNSGKAPKWKGRVFLYKGIKFRSSWEMKYAQFLDKNNIKWSYEPKFILQDGRCFSPDFLLECGRIIEIKGFWTEKAKEKWAMFCSLKPEIDKKILYKQDLIQLGISI